MPPDPATVDPIAAKICQQKGYVFDKLLGEGSFKRVYLVHDGSRPLALKVSVMPARDQRLERETQALKSCNHPSVAKIYDASKFEDNGRIFWFSLEEFLDGGTLEQRISGPMSPQDVKSLGVALADVLVHFRPLKIVHRDIKPANVMYRAGHSLPVLTDFGVARILGESTLTQDFMGLGPCTPRYASPEQLNNEKVLIDFRTDQFGLALLLSECLLARHAFQHNGNDANGAILDVQARVPLPLQSENELTSLGFNCLVKALGPYPVTRYSDPSSFASVLAAI